MKKNLFNYFNPLLNLALAWWDVAYKIMPDGSAPVRLNPEYYKGNLVYRMPGSYKRISYRSVKAGPQCANSTVFEKMFTMPF
jgi:hypothetical protein